MALSFIAETTRARRLRDASWVQTEWGARSVRRPFHWGIVLLGDSSADLDLNADATDNIRTGRHHLAIAVRHAQDVDDEPDVALDQPIPPFEVTVSCRVQPHAETDAQFSAVLNVPSGRISLGDADEEIYFNVSPGGWLVQLTWQPADHPEHVDVRVSPTPLDNRTD
jgi:hypothetical protein